MPLFCDTALAARIERAESGLVARTADAARRRLGNGAGFAIPVRGGIASFTEADSPFNKVAGLGFHGVPEEAELDAIERAFAGRAAPVQVELADLADPAIGAALTGRGYRLVNFENVLGLDLAAAPRPVTPPGVEVRPIGEDHFGQWLDVVIDGFAHGDDQGVPSHEQFPREVVAAAERDLVTAGAVCYLAWHDGVVAGGASVHTAGGIAQLTGAATATSIWSRSSRQRTCPPGLAARGAGSRRARSPAAAGILDLSRNGSRRWCDMSGCGNRAKNRAWRARRSGSLDRLL